MNILINFLIPPVVSGLIGGFIGVCFNSKVEVYGWRLTILSSVSGIIFSGAVAEYLYYNYGEDHLFIHCAIGITTGVIGSSGLDALKIIAPKWTIKLIDKLGNTVIDSIPNHIDFTKEENKDVNKQLEKDV